jgi:hypothetical protein
MPSGTAITPARPKSFKPDKYDYSFDDLAARAPGPKVTRNENRPIENQISYLKLRRY